MADLGNLWFSLGLDDSKFEKQWKAAFNKYQQQSKIDVAINIGKADLTQLNDIQNKLAAFTKNFNGNTKATIDVKVTQNTLDTLQAFRNMGGTKAQWQAVREAARAAGEFARNLERANNAQNASINKFKTQSFWLQNLSTLASNYFSLYAVKSFVTELATVSGEFEKQRKTLQAMVGEMQGLEIYGKMKELAVVSPFEFKDLASYAKQLAAFSVPYEELYDTTKRLADVSAGLGVDMSRIILAYGQIRSAGVLRGTELRQLTEAGVPILEKLAAKFTELEGKAVSVGDVFGKISKKMVSFEMVKDVFTELTSEGGKFYNMQEIQAETLSGKIANLKDAYAIMLSEIGESTEGWLKGGVERLYKLINNWETLGRVIISVASAYGVYQTAQVAAFSWEKLKLIGLFAQKMLEFNFNIKKAVESMVTLKLASSAGIWGVLLAALTGIGVALWQADKAAKAFNQELDKIYNKQGSELRSEIRALNDIKEALDNAAEGSQNRRDAIEQFNRQFGGYLQNMLTEKSTANELAIAYDKVTESIKNKNKQEGFIKAQSLIDEEYGDKVATTVSSMVDRLKRGSGSWQGLDEDLAEGVAIKIRTELEKNINLTRNELEEILKKRFGDEVGKSAINILDNIADSGETILTQRDLINVLQGELKEYNSILEKTRKKYERLSRTDNYSLKAEADLVERVNKKYDEKIAKLKERNLTQEEYNNQLKGLKSLKLQELAEGYGAMGLTEKANEYLAQWEKLVDVTTGWRKDIADLISGFSTKEIKIPTVFNPKEDENWLSYKDRIKKEYKELKESVESIGADPDNELPILKAQMAALEAVAKAYKIVLDAKGDKKAETEAEKAEKKRVNSLKEQYEWILKIAQAYERLTKQGATPEVAMKSILDTFKNIPEDIKIALESSGDWTILFAEKFKALSDEAKKNGSDVGIALANSISQGASSLNVTEVIEALKLGEQIKNELEKWGLEDFALLGQGIELDISKVLKEQSVADNQVYARRKELLDKLAKAEKGDADEIAALKLTYGNNWAQKAKEDIERLAKLEIDNNQKVAQEKINDLAKKAAKEDLDKVLPIGFMESLGDKSLSQLKEAQAELQKLSSSEPDFMFDAEFLDKLAAAEVDLDEFIEAYREYFRLQGKDIDAQIGEEAKENLLSALNAAKQLVSAFRGLVKEGSALEGVLDFVDMSLGVAESIAKGDMWAAAIQVVTGVVNQIAAAKQYREEMERAADSLQNSIALTRRELKIAGEEFNTIFGEDLISAFNADSEAINDITKQLKSSSKEVANMKVVTRKGFFGIGRKQATLQDLAPQLFNANGTVNYSYLDEFLSAYGSKLSEGQKLILENLRSTYEQYEDAMSDISDYLSNIFSDTASTIADRMMEAFAATGNAATDLGDLVSNVAKSMAKDLIQSLLIDQYLTPSMDRIKSMYNPQSEDYEEDVVIRTQKAIIAMQDAMAAAQMAVPEVNRLLQGLRDMGIDLETESNNASEVLSGLGEDQQNLLVAYINGIRADVSINKGLLTSIVNSVSTINNNIASAIIVWKQIESNTHRSADGVDRIIGFFESVMGPYDGGGGQAFRVNIA